MSLFGQQRPIMLVGPRKCGKSILADILNGRRQSRKSSVVFGEKSIEVPGSYLECPWMYQHIIALQQKASAIWMLVPLKFIRTVYPPKFAAAFRVPVQGVITCLNQEYTEADWQKAKEELMAIGIKPPYYTFNLETDKEIKQII